MPITGADLPSDRVLPFYDEKNGVPLHGILTDQGTEYCGNPEHYEYELYLAYTQPTLRKLPFGDVVSLAARTGFRTDASATQKPSIQALERAQGYLRLPNGRALTGQSHDYKRHGTTTLFAASPLPSPAGVASRGPKGRFARRRHRQGHRPPFQAPPPGRVPRFHERGHSRQSRRGDPYDPRQSLNP